MTKEAEDVLAAIKALRPGEDVEIGQAQDGKPIIVHVRDVALKDMQEFTNVIGTTIPQMMSTIASYIREEAADTKLDLDTLVKNPDLLMNALSRPMLIGRLIPMVIQSLSDMIDRCVQPEGIFKELPWDMTAPVVQKWLELNVLDSGKIQSWAKALAGLVESLQKTLPASESSAATS